MAYQVTAHNWARQEEILSPIHLSKILHVECYKGIHYTCIHTYIHACQRVKYCVFVIEVECVIIHFLILVQWVYSPWLGYARQYLRISW